MKIEELIVSPNVCELLDADQIASLEAQLYNEVQLDLSSRLDWEERNEKAIKLALQVVEKKTFPWPGASNVKFPLITISAMQYHSRAYPALISNNEVVKCKVYGKDDDGELHKRADRISRHMTYQVMEEDESWEENMDKTLLVQAIAGTAVKKSFFDPVKGHNVSELILPDDFIVNYYTKTIACTRSTSVPASNSTRHFLPSAPTTRSLPSSIPTGLTANRSACSNRAPSCFTSPARPANSCPPTCAGATKCCNG